MGFFRRLWARWRTSPEPIDPAPAPPRGHAELRLFVPQNVSMRALHSGLTRGGLEVREQNIEAERFEIKCRPQKFSEENRLEIRIRGEQTPRGFEIRLDCEILVPTDSDKDARAAQGALFEMLLAVGWRAYVRDESRKAS